MNRVLTVISLVLLTGGLAACGGARSRTVTVTTTVTVTATPSASASSDATADTSAAADASSSATAGTTDSGPDACSLLTQAQANAAASTPLQKGTGAGKDAAGNYVMCQWIGLTNGPTAELEVYVGDGAKQQLHIEKDNLGHSFTSVPGIGDQCLQEDGYIFVQKGGLWVSLHLVRLNDPAQNVKPMQTGIREIAAELP